MIERTVYECEHCHKKRLVSKYAMRDHEKECFYNPDSKSCILCENFIQDNSDIERGCLMKQDLRFKLKTNCLYWKQKEINEEEF